MKTNTYTLGQRCLAYILFVSFFLQSCNNFSDPLMPIGENQSPGEGRSKIKAREIQQSTKLMAQGGHIVAITEQEGQLTATVKEYLPAGFSKTHAYIPVYVGGDTSIRDISQLKEQDQKKLVEVSLPSSKKKGYVYIGKRGLPGGMTQDSEEENNQEEGEEVKRPTISSYYVDTGNKEDVNQLKSNYVNPLGKPALQKQAQSPQTSAATEVEFTSLHKHNYQVFKKISVEMAQEVEKQTGLLIPFQPGKTTTEFVGGRGAFGELRLGREKVSGKYFGIKIQGVHPAQAQETYDEVRLQLKLSGLPHLMPLIDVGEEESGSTLYQVMPLASLGNGAQLATYLQNLKDSAFKEAILLHVSKGILQGIAAMHGLSASMAHLDFKPDNLVIDKDGEVYIIDFGCAALLDGQGQIKGIGKGDRRYYSPERYVCMLEGKESMLDAQAIDSWAVGLTLLELVAGLIEDKEDIVENTPGHYLSYPFLAQAAPSSYAGVIKGLLNPDPRKRLSVQEALKMEIFQQETRPEVLSLLKEFVQTLQWSAKKAKLGNQGQGLTSVQQLPLAHFASYASRPQLEAVIVNQLKSKASLVACVGIGGIGKTQLLTHLVHSEEIKHMYEHVYWFQLSNQEDALLEQYRGLAQELTLVDEKATKPEAKEALLSWLEEQKDGSILLVFDNGDDPALLKSFLPKKSCQVLVSSRSPEWENKIGVDVFSESEVREMVSKLLPDRSTTVEESKLLGETLGYLPLALGQAIAYMREGKMSIKEYVAIYQEKQKELLTAKKDLFGKSLPYSMVTLYQMQSQKLLDSCPEAIQLLEYSALLAADNIPVGLLEGDLLGKGIFEAVYKKAVQALLSYGLWQEAQGARMVRIHRLMQEVVRLGLTAEKLKERFSKLATHLDVYNEKVTVLADEGRLKAIVPHLEALSILAAKDPNLSQEAPSGNLLNAMGRYYVKPQLVMQEEGAEEKGSTQKKGIEVEKLFDQLDETHPAVGKVLLLGGAGAGKSTLLNHLYEQWAAGSLWKETYSHVFRVSLKELLNPLWLSGYSPAEQKDILACFIDSCWKGQTTSRRDPGNQQKRAYKLGDVSSLLQDPKEKEKVLLLVDGYDEIAGLQGREAYKQIVEAGVFRHPHMLVASRPNAASKEIRAKFERQIESQGLDEEGINQYISLQFKEGYKQQLGQELQAFLKSNYQVRGMCQLPINLALLCIIWKDPEIRARLLQGKEQEAQSSFQLGQLYEELLRWLGRRHANKAKLGQGAEGKVAEVTDEILREDKVYKALEEVAYTSFTGQGLGVGKEMGTLGIPGRLLEEMVRKQDKKLQLSELIEYGLLKGEGDPNKPLEQVYEFIHLSFQEYLTAAHLQALLSQEGKEKVSEVATFIAYHRNEPKYLLTLKFLAGLVSQSKDKRLVERFWETVSCNVEGVLELGVERKMTLLMHLLGQSRIQTEVDPRIPNLAKIREWIDQEVLADLAKWEEQLLESGYMSNKIVEAVDSIVQRAARHQTPEGEGAMLQLKAAVGLIRSLVDRASFSHREKVFERLVAIMKGEPNWQIQQVALEQASQLIDETLDSQKLKDVTKELWKLSIDKNLQKTARAALAKIGTIMPLEMFPLIQPLLADNEIDVRFSAIDALIEIVKLVPELGKEAFRFVQTLLADKDRNVREGATLALSNIAKFVPELGKEALPLVQPLLADTDADVRSGATDVFGEIVKSLPGNETLQLVQTLLAEKYSDVRISATYILKEIVKVLPELGKEAFPFVQTLLADKDTNVQKSATSALREIVKVVPGKETFPFVQTLLADKDMNVRFSAIDALIEIVKLEPALGKEAFPFVQTLLASKDWKVTSSGTHALREIVKVVPGKEAFRFVQTLLSDTNADVRKSATDALIDIVKLEPALGKEAFPFVQILLSDTNADVRKSATDAVREIVKLEPALGKEAFPFVQTLLGDKDWNVQLNAINALIAIVKLEPTLGKEAFPFVQALLADKDHSIRISAASALIKIVQLAPELGQGAFPFVQTLLANKDRNVRLSATHALRDIIKLEPALGKEAFSLVQPLLADEDSHVRNSATYALRDIIKLEPELGKEALPFVQTLLADKDDGVRINATPALIEIVKLEPELGKEAFPLVKTLLANKDEYVRGQTNALIEIVKVVPGKEAFPFVQTLLADQYADVRKSATDALREIVKLEPALGKEVFPFVQTLLADTNANVRSSATYALREIVKLVPELGKEAFPLIQTLLANKNYNAQSSVTDALREIVQRLSLAELRDLLADVNPTIRTQAKEVLAKKFQSAEERAQLNYREISSLLKIMAANKDRIEDLDKALYHGANQVLQHIAENISQEGIQWLNAHFSELGDLPEVQAFLRAVQHTCLSDKNIDDGEADLMFKCIVEKGITATFDLLGNRITLGDIVYPLHSTSQPNLQRVVSEVIKLSQDMLTQQYRDHKPLFINSGSALPIAQIDKPDRE